ncbi:Class E basic helix-loop-helix protein 40, partial [Merops nubicus]
LCLQTLGHLEKAVVLELTLKHVKALTNLIEQQQQKILALQSGLQAGDLSSRNLDSSQEMFRSGFQMCAKEMLQYLAKHENGKDLKPSQLVSHLHRMASEVLQGGAARKAGDIPPKMVDLKEKPAPLGKAAEGHGKNCVPFAHSSGEQSGSDTDTDSGYGGELEKSDSKPEQPYFRKDTDLKYAVQERISSIKQETEDPPAKRSRLESPEDEGPFGGDVMGSTHGVHEPRQNLPPSADAPETPLSRAGPFPHRLLGSASSFEADSMLEKCWYPASVPVLYPSLPASAAALTGFMNPDKISPPLLMPQRLPSPVPAHSPIDSSALLQALKQIPPLNLETKD